MLSNIKKDKWRHFIVGVCMGLLFEGVALHYFPDSPWAGSFIVFGFVLLICYGFELASLVFKRGHYDVIDAVAGILGGLMGMVIMISVQFMH
jgi:hypothetical protein